MSWNLKRMFALQASEAGPASIQVKHTRSWSKQALLPGGAGPPCPAQHESYADRWEQRRGRHPPEESGPTIVGTAYLTMSVSRMRH